MEIKKENLIRTSQPRMLFVEVDPNQHKDVGFFFRKKNKLARETAVFVFPGNYTHHKPGVTLFTLKKGEALADIAHQLGQKYNVPTLSLPTVFSFTHVAPIDEEKSIALAKKAIADLYEAIGRGFHLYLPVRKHEEGIFDGPLCINKENNIAYEPALWGGIANVSGEKMMAFNKRMASFYLNELKQMHYFMLKFSKNQPNALHVLSSYDFEYYQAYRKGERERLCFSPTDIQNPKIQAYIQEEQALLIPHIKKQQLNKIRRAIKNAYRRYETFCNTRKIGPVSLKDIQRVDASHPTTDTYGWFSWLRHAWIWGGLSKAKAFTNKYIEKLSSDASSENLSNMYQDLLTMHANDRHSFASYVLDELNLVISDPNKQNSVKSRYKKTDVDKCFRQLIEDLQQVSEQEEKVHVNMSEKLPIKKGW